MWCVAFNQLMDKDITIDTIHAEIFPADFAALLAQEERYTDDLGKDLLSGKILQPEYDQEKEDNARRIQELKSNCIDEHTVNLVTLLKKIQDVLGPNRFDIDTFDICSNTPRKIITSEELDEGPLKRRFLRGEYGVISINFADKFTEQFGSIRSPIRSDIIDHIQQRILNRGTAENAAENAAENEALIGLLKAYLDYPSGHQKLIKDGPDLDPDPVTMLDTFIAMIANVGQETEHGHAIVIKSLFETNVKEALKEDYEDDVAEKLGTIFAIVKNTWGKTWGLGGELVLPISILPDATIIMFTLIASNEAYAERNKSVSESDMVSPLSKMGYREKERVIPPSKMVSSSSKMVSSSSKMVSSSSEMVNPLSEMVRQLIERGSSPRELSDHLQRIIAQQNDKPKSKALQPKRPAFIRKIPRRARADRGGKSSRKHRKLKRAKSWRKSRKLKRAKSWRKSRKLKRAKSCRNCRMLK
jgi:hypothetical protein